MAAIACAGWAVLSTWQTIQSAGDAMIGALWLLPALVALHLVQLLLSAGAWRILLPGPPVGLVAFYRFRLIREGIDSLLPVAQVGGEIVGARLLARTGIAAVLSTASIVVDVTLEFLSQIGFLLIGLAAWAAMAPRPDQPPSWTPWFAFGLAAGAAVGLLVAQRFGLLRVVEALSRQIAARLPALTGLSLDGLHEAAILLYTRRGPVTVAGGLHLVAWLLGSLESWAVMNTLAQDVTFSSSLVIESLGMAGRSAGFAVPGALLVQETGFVLAAAAMGLPDSAGLALSLLKRVREVSTGLIGCTLWQWAERVRMPVVRESL